MLKQKREEDSLSLDMKNNIMINQKSKALIAKIVHKMKMRVVDWLSKAVNDKSEYCTQKVLSVVADQDQEKGKGKENEK